MASDFYIARPTKQKTDCGEFSCSNVGMHEFGCMVDGCEYYS